MRIPDDADPGLSHNNATGILKYEFDEVFDADCSQNDIFESIAKEKILDVFDGINSTLLAYGQTGSGKTFTIFGGDSFADRGLIPRSIIFLFKEIRSKVLENFVVKCQISFTEVYKETVYDLLDKQKKNLPIEQWTPVQVLEGVNGLTLRNLNVFEVESEDDALSLFFLGNTNRLTSSTIMNDVSSRSHAIFTMIIESKGLKNGKTLFTSGKMNFVDLAGSERVYKVHS
jgi:kinesin family protein 6/9